MAEFGNQIDIEYEVWQEHDGHFAQIACGGWDYDPMPLDQAQKYVDDCADWSQSGYRALLVEVVSVRTEYGVADAGA